MKIDVNRIEFSVTMQCTGKCKHCSVGADADAGKSGAVDAELARTAINELCSRYNIESIMTFGGEPLLYPEVTAEIHKTAKECGIPQRDIITNGFFSKDEKRIAEVAALLKNAGVNGIMISVDAFHQETIPLEPVRRFAEAVMENGITNTRLHPAWLVSREDDNEYNRKTREILASFDGLGIIVSSGNVIFPSGSAVRHLGAYFPPPDETRLHQMCGEVPYTASPDEITSVNISPDGSVRTCFEIGNLYDNSVLEILGEYDPYVNETTRILIKEGAYGLLKRARDRGEEVDLSDCYSACALCRKLNVKYSKS